MKAIKVHYIVAKHVINRKVSIEGSLKYGAEFLNQLSNPFKEFLSRYC